MKRTVFYEYEQKDFDYLHDIMLEIDGISRKYDDLVKIFGILPEELKDEVVRWGMDTETRVMILRWLTRNKDKIK